jgi:metallo-beta-lactamase family protein
LSQSRSFAQTIVAPAMGETYQLGSAAGAKRIKTGDPALEAAVGRDWQNSYADFTTHLKAELARIEDVEARLKAIAAMRDVLSRYREVRAAQGRRAAGR